jgi:immune inhibitor A
MRHGFRYALTTVLLLLMIGCTEAKTTPTPEPTPPAIIAAPTQTLQPTEEAEPPAEPTAAVAPEPTAKPVPTPEPIAFVWPPPIEAEDDLSRNPVSEAEHSAEVAFAAAEYPYVDFLAEALSHQLISEPIDAVVATEAAPLNEGTVKDFWILNTDANTWGLVEMRLLGISENAYFWFDTDRNPSTEKVQDAMDAFAAIYEPMQAVFGGEDVPGVDGDPHIFILHPSGTKLCNVSEDFAHTCFINGYFFAVNQIPSAIIAQSNEHEGLIMNLDSVSASLGSEGYRETLVHEFRHLVVYWYDEQNETWETEGSAVMAEEILSFGNLNLEFANFFMADPDLQLNTWAEGSLSLAHYGQGYVINRYIYDRFGESFYSQWQQDPDGGFYGLNKLLSQNGMETTAVQLWLDWLVTLVTHTNPNAPAKYRFARDFNVDTVGQTAIPAFPRTIEDEVDQYGADIYRFSAEHDLLIDFIGTTKTSLIGRLPTSGQQFWYSGRVSGSLPKLTRSIDLTGVDSATLQFDTFYKLSNAFGFAYVLVSTDGGETWSGLVGENMRGDEAHHDPLNLALAERFYTGVAPGGNWVHETIDLTPYAGQEILIRFESDGNDRSIGFALDNLAIPELGFYDDAETDTGWDAEGWVRTTAYIPQTFHLQLITFDNGVPIVTPIQLDELNIGQFEVNGLTNGNEEAYLIVAASAPHSVETAVYTFDVSAK